MATVTIILETRKVDKLKRHPVKLRITHLGERHYYTLRYVKLDVYEAKREEMPESLKFNAGQTIWLTPNEYNRTQKDRPREPYSVISMVFAAYLEAAVKMVNGMKNFSFEKFDKEYHSEKTDKADVYSMLNARARELKEADRISTANLYKSTAASLKKFTNTDKLPFEKLTVQFLNKYEKWFLEPEIIRKKLKNGKTEEVIRVKSITTIGMYLRNVREVYNKAIKAGIILKEEYPFAEGDYSIPGGVNIKKALSFAEVKQIEASKVDTGSPQQRYRDYWLFLYVGNGMNVKDMAKLRYSNIQGELVSFIRSKTAREKRENPKLVQVVITKPLGRIMDSWGTKPGNQNDYLFPILRNGMNAEQELKAVQQATKQINKYIGKIAKEIGIKQKVTTYVARHSYATVLKNSGAPVAFISENLGHYSVQTTEKYLGSMEFEKKKEYANKTL